MRAVGINIKSGVLYLAYAQEQLGADLRYTAVDGAPRRLRPNSGLGQAALLADVTDRLEQDLRSYRPDRVGLVATRLHANWKYSSAYDRVVLISAAMAACTRLGIEYKELKTEAIGRVTRTPAARLGAIPYSIFGFSDCPAYWTTGLAEAFGAAALLIDEGVPSDG